MAKLRALLLKNQIDQAKKRMADLEAESENLAKREADLQEAIAEAETEEEQRACEEAVDAYEADRSANTAAIADLDAEIRELENALAAEEAAQDTTPPTAPVPAAESEKRNNREEINMPETRTVRHFGLTDEILRREDNAAFLREVRSCIKEKRALTNAGLLVTDTFLGIIRENVINYSKLYRHCFVRNLKGAGKLAVMGTVPEAIWTACCGILNEIDLTFSQVQVDCNKVAAFIPVCNATLEDSDIALAAEIIQALLISLGKGLDKAILFGTGSGMPLGVYTRLAQTSQPAGYPANAPAWVDLHTSNMFTIANSVTGVSLFQTIMLDAAVMSGKYSRENITWVMNETTYKYLKAQGMNVNAAGAIVSAVEGEMPAVGGTIEVLDFVPNYEIIAGYFDLYLLADRQGMRVESTELARYVEDETIFRAKGRYDGLPVIANAFAVFAINSASLQSVSFDVDLANTPAYVMLNKAAAAVTAATGANHTAQLKATVLNIRGEELKGQTITWASGTAAKATVSDAGLVTGVSAGSSVITASCGEAVAVCNVTVS